jgi:hypothetical protein
MATRVDIGKGGVIPAGLADRWELLVGEAAKRIKKKRDQIKTSIGARPYNGLPVDEDELRARWMEIRRDPNAVFDVMAENVRFTKEGKVMLPKELVNKIVDYETKARRSGAGV